MNDLAFATTPLAGKMVARTKSPTFTVSLQQERKKAVNRKFQNKHYLNKINLKQAPAWQTKEADSNIQ